MSGISRKTIVKAAVATVASVVISVSIVLLLVPMLGGHPDGPGFWMSVLCPLLIAAPASTWQFHQRDVIERQRDQLAHMHVELEDMHAELRSLHDNLRWRARRDHLTGGLNREAVFATLGELAPTHKAHAALLVVDADHFKTINDSFGHLTGDEALRRIAAAIDTVTGEEDIWGRIGGEEFIVFLPGAAPDAAAGLAGRLRQSIEDIRLMVEGRRVPLSVSIGAATGKGAFDPIELFRKADADLYRAKSAGRNRVVFDGRPLDPLQA